MPNTPMIIAHGFATGFAISAALVAMFSSDWASASAIALVSCAFHLAIISWKALK